MTVTEYARHRGVTHPYISKLLRAGKLERIGQGPYAKRLDAEACDARLAALRDPSKDGVRVRNEIDRTMRGASSLFDPISEVTALAPEVTALAPGSGADSLQAGRPGDVPADDRGADRQAQPAGSRDISRSPADASDGYRIDPHDPSFMRLQQSRAKSEAERARILELDRLEREARLVDAELVRKQAMAQAREARNAVLAMPARCAPLFVPMLADGQGTAVVEQLLTQIARDLCVQIAAAVADAVEAGGA